VDGPDSYFLVNFALIGPIRSQNLGKSPFSIVTSSVMRPFLIFRSSLSAIDVNVFYNLLLRLTLLSAARRCSRKMVKCSTR